MKKRLISKRTGKKWLSFCLVCLLFFTFAPLQGVAQEFQSDIYSLTYYGELPANLQILLGETDVALRASANAGVQTAAYSARGGSEASVQLVADTDLYGLNIQFADGSGKAEKYLIPVKYVDDNGRVQYIDTGMESVGLLSSLFGSYDYQNIANSFTVRYSEDAAVGLDYDGLFTMAVKQPSSAADDGYISTEADTGNGMLVYPDAFGEDTYIEYINTNTGIKENIVLEQNIGQNTFSFVFRSETLVPVAVDNGACVELRENGVTVYTLSPLYAYDSYVRQGYETYQEGDHRHYTENCSYRVAEEADGSYTITVVVDSAWLNHPETVYPVVIDPSVTATVENANITDTSVVQGNPGAYYYSYGYMRFGYGSAADKQRMYGLVKFGTLPTLPAETYITDATLTLKFRSGQSTAADGACHMVTSSANFNATNWNNQPSVQSAPLSYSSHNSVTQYIFDVTAAAKKWYDGTAPNYGLRFGYRDETVVDYNTVYSSEASSAANAPKLTVNYNYYVAVPSTGIDTAATYFARNSHSGMYMTADKEVLNSTLMQNAYDSNFTDKQLQFSRSPISAYYKMQIGDYVLTMNADYSVTLQYDTNQSAAYWQIIRETDGSYKFVNQLYQTVNGYTFDATLTPAGASTASCVVAGFMPSNTSKWYLEPLNNTYTELDVYTITEASTNTVLTVHQQAFEGAQVCSEASSLQSHQLWRFEKVDERYYRIYAMHHNNLLLWCDADGFVTMKEGTADNASAANAHWIINMGQIQSALFSTQYLAANDQGHKRVFIVDFVPPGLAVWSVDEYVNDTSWQGTYTGWSKGQPLYYTFIDTRTFEWDRMNESTVHNAFNRWRNISSSIDFVFVPEAQIEQHVQSGKKIHITVYAENIVQMNTNQWYTEPIVQGQPTSAVSALSENWDAVNIHLRTKSATYREFSEETFIALVAHEIGHALKLTHYRENTDSNNQDWQTLNKKTFPAVMQANISLDDGNTYLKASDRIQSYTLTNFDKSALRTKWGK